jgi:hypothetical protein
LEEPVLNKPTELTTEQEFALKAFQMQASSLSLEQAQNLLVELYRQILVRETIYKDLLKKDLLVDWRNWSA